MMIKRKKLLLVVAIFCAWGTGIRAAEIEWTATSGTIPDDGNTYYVIKQITTTGFLTNNGTLEIRSGGHISTGANIENNKTIEIKTGGQISLNGNNFDNRANNATLNISGGTFHFISGTFKNALASGSTNVNVTGGLFKMSGGIFHNGATGTFTTAYFTASSNGTFELAGGIFTNASAGDSIGYLIISAPAQFVVGNGDLIEGLGFLSQIDIFGSNLIDLSLSSGTLTIKSGRTFTLPSGSTLSINSDGTLINNGTLNVNENASLNTDGDLQNLSSSSVNIYGNVYTYSFLENGNAGNAGTININYPGNLYLLSAELRNGHASSAININAGGGLHSYHGIVDAALGNLDLKTGGYFNNIRGNNPGGYLSITAGSVFVENDIIALDQTIELDYIWTITNKSTINAQGNKIIFGTNGGIVIDGADASLLLKDAIIEDISGNQIRCTEDTTTLSVDNVVWIQDANYSFTKGTISVNGDWTISGTGTQFAYQTSQESTIQQKATMRFDYGTTFSFDSATSTNIAMINKTSVLHLNGSTLYAAEDVRFKKGTILFDDITTYNGASKSIYFGNNNVSDNVTLDAHPNADPRTTANVTLVNQNV
jgi:hypothetical protein